MGMVEIKGLLMSLKRGKDVGERWLKEQARVHGCTEEDLWVCIENGWLIELPPDKKDTLWHEKKYMLTEEGFRITWS